jgi:hypothetical protein
MGLKSKPFRCGWRTLWVLAVCMVEIGRVGVNAGNAPIEQVGSHLLRLPIIPVAMAGFSLCFGRRVRAIRYGWQLPIAKARDRQASRGDDGDGAQDR